MAKTVNINISLTDDQKVFFSSTAPHFLWGSTRGSGKTWAILRYSFLKCIKNKNFTCIIFRNYFTTQVELWREAEQLTEEFGVGKPHRQTKSIVFPNGSVVRFAAASNEIDIAKMQGINVHLLLIDEATTIDPVVLERLLGIVRSKKGDYPARICYFCNPGGIAHNYIKKLFISPITTGEWSPREGNFNFTDELGVERQTLLTLSKNNTFLDTDAYFKNLGALNEDLISMWKENNWDVVAGAFFDNIAQVLTKKQPNYEWDTIVLGLDVGYRNTSCIMGAVNHEGVITIAESTLYQDMSAEEVAIEIKDRYFSKYEIPFIATDPSAWSVSSRDGRSVAEDYLKVGLPLVKANNDHKQGLFLLRNDIKDGRLKIIKDSCLGLVEDMQSAQTHPKNPEDIQGTTNLHHLDALRYLVITSRLKGTVPLTPQEQKELAYAEGLQKEFGYLFDNRRRL